MRIAIVGSGIAGLNCARLLSPHHEVVLFEANDYFGGHTHTHEVEHAGRCYSIDTGFIVYNQVHYPLLTAMFAELGLASRATSMSFSVQCAASGLEYNATGLGSLFCQRRNLMSPRFWGMLRDVLRFYREAPALLAGPGPGPSLSEYLSERRFGAAFAEEHLIPMASALWSAPAQQILSFPARHLVQFMRNHQMLQVSGRPEWRVVIGGSASYVRALRSRWQVRERLSCPVRSVRRLAQRVELTSAAGTESFDQVVLACHGDEALRLLADPTVPEREVLGAIRYQPNDTVLHTDASLLPRNRRAWAAWNAYVPSEARAVCTVSYYMNLLQGVAAPEPFIVTLNRTEAIDAARVLRRVHYTHPVYDAAAMDAQRRKAEIQGRQLTWFAGAYWGFGFHEDGMRSAVEVAQALERGCSRRPSAPFRSRSAA